MAAFGGFTLTNRGRALQSKAQAGTQLVYTKAMIGDGSLTSQSIVTLTNLISPKMTLPITSVRPAPPDRAYVESKFDNQSIATGFYFREIGVYAQDPDLGEILYAYANAGQNAEYIPPTGGTDIVEKSIRMNVFVGAAANITATIDSSLVFPTYEQMEDAIEAALSSVKVPLIDSNTSTSKTEAPTADALRRTVESMAEALGLKQNTVRLADNYLTASVLVNAAPDAQGRSYPDGLSFFKVSSSAGAWPTSNGYVVTMRAGSGGFQLYFEMYTGTTQTDKTSRFWYRSKRDANTFWQDWTRNLTDADLDDTLNSTSKTKAATADALRRVNEAKMDANRNSNLIPNGTAAYGFAGWTFAGGSNDWYASKASGDAPGEFSFRAATGGVFRYIQSEPLPVSPGAVYNLSAELWAEGAATGDLYVEILPATSGGNFGAVIAQSTDRWLRRNIDVTVPAGVNSAIIRMVVPANKAATYKGFRRVQLTLGLGARPWNDDSDGYVARRWDLLASDYRALELGLLVPGDGPAYIDFHTSAVSRDYNARILAEAGSSTNGGGDVSLYYNAKDHRFTGPLYVDGTDLKKSVSDGKKSVRDIIVTKGGTVADADGDGIPDFSELVAGVNSIVVGYKAIPGETVLQGPIYTGNYPSPTYTKAWQVRTNIPGTFRLRYTVVNTGSGLGYARVYKNGVPFGTERTVSPGNPASVSYVEDLAFSAGDTIEFWVRAQTTNSNNVRLDNIQVLSNIPIFSAT